MKKEHLELIQQIQVFNEKYSIKKSKGKNLKEHLIQILQENERLTEKIRSLSKQIDYYYEKYSMKK